MPPRTPRPLLGQESCWTEKSACPQPTEQAIDTPTGIFTSVLAFPGYCAIPDQSKQPVERADLDELSTSAAFYLFKVNPELLRLF
jgi:hypothetical protein